MKKNLFSQMAGALVLLLSAAGCVAKPAPLADANAVPVTEPVSYYGGVDVFEVKSVPLMVKITTTPGMDEPALASTLKDVIDSTDIQCSPAGKPFDIQINVNSVYKELTPAPRCFLSHQLTFTVAAADGTRLQPVWKHKTEALRAYATQAEARAALMPIIRESIKEWEKNHFRREAGKVLQASVVRVKTSRYFLDTRNAVRFDEDVRKVLNKLRKSKGVVEVRLIEADESKRIASFRVLSRGNVPFTKQIKK